MPKVRRDALLCTLRLRTQRGSKERGTGEVSTKTQNWCSSGQAEADAATAAAAAAVSQTYCGAASS